MNNINLDPKNKGKFTRYCKEQGFKGVTCGCILKGIKSPNKLTRKRAWFAYEFGFVKNGKICPEVEKLKKQEKLKETFEYIGNIYELEQVINENIDLYSLNEEDAEGDEPAETSTGGGGGETGETGEGGGEFGDEGEEKNAVEPVEKEEMISIKKVYNAIKLIGIAVDLLMSRYPDEFEKYVSIYSKIYSNFKIFIFYFSTYEDKERSKILSKFRKIIKIIAKKLIDKVESL